MMFRASSPCLISAQPVKYSGVITLPFTFKYKDNEKIQLWSI